MAKPWAIDLRIPEKYRHLLFGGLLTIISGSVVLVNSDFPLQWLRAFATAWPIAFPSVLLVAPVVRKVVTRLTAPSE
ncbi:MAG: DUF2798 domain-containing protein [Gallionella sp.]|nr:DUF2798 domain-containing protein [Gallionella sp.]MDD4946889.1 DUF2798 domain-containing protein [Gallionella sp.]